MAVAVSSLKMTSAFSKRIRVKGATPEMVKPVSDSGGGADAERLLPVLPKPGRLVMFDSEQPHMSKPPTIIAEPFAPPLLNHVPSTRTQGNRFAVVTRALCGRKTSKELVAEYGSGGFVSRHQAQSMFEALDVGTPRDLATRLLGGASRASPLDLDRLFRIPSADQLRARLSLRGGVPVGGHR